MKTLIVLKSIHCGNTEKIAKAMAKELNADVIGIGEFNSSLVSRYDLIGFGSGIYMQKHHKGILKAAESLPDSSGKTFIFSTCGSGIMWSFYHRRLRRILSRKGFTVLGEFSCRGRRNLGSFAVSKSKPGEKDMQKAVQFARSLGAMA